MTLSPESFNQTPHVRRNMTRNMTTPAAIVAYSLADPASAKPILARALDHLRQPAYFKTALPLYRRLQFGRFLDSSFLYTNLQLDDSSDPNDQHGGNPWFYAFVDRRCRPETEVWMFGSWEIEARLPINNTSSASASDDRPHANGTSKDDERIRALLLALLASITSRPLTPSIHAPEAVLAAQSQIATSNTYKLKPSSAATQAPNPNIILWGAVHAATTAHVCALGLAATHILPVLPNHTFIFPLSALPAPASLPPTLRWGKLQPQHFPLVRSRTEIARQDFTLAHLPNLAIFPVEPAEAAPVAWAFVGLDGSLTSLHTEAEWRRMGLAKALTAKLFREEMDFFWEDGVERLAHGNVAVGNEASASMCKQLGGSTLR